MYLRILPKDWRDLRGNYIVRKCTGCAVRWTAAYTQKKSQIGYGRAIMGTVEVKREVCRIGQADMDHFSFFRFDTDGIGSYPDPPQGLQRATRRSVCQSPCTGPYVSSASMA